MNCAITGANGVLGSHFIKRFKDKIKFHIYKDDILNKRKLNSWIKKNNFDYLIHLAAKTSTKEVDLNLNHAKKVNYLSLIELINLLKKKKKKLWFFFASSSHVYKHSKYSLKEDSDLKPKNNYGKFKLLAEKYIKKSTNKNLITFCIGRIFSFTDIKQKKDFFIPNVLRKKNQIVNTYRDFLHIDDVCDAIYFLMKKKISGTYNIGSGKKINLIKLINLINQTNLKLKDYKHHNGLFANIDKIKKKGWVPKKKLKNIINDIKKI